MAEAEGSDDTSDELLNKSLSVWSAKSVLGKEKFEPIPLDLHTASSLGQYECVKKYITRGEVDLDRRNTGGWTAVMYACYIGHEGIVSLLLEADINVNIRNHKGETPLMLAASCGNERVGFLLCGHGAELELKDERGWTALFHATYSGHQNMVRFLLEQGANINAVEPSVGMTPFMEAAAEGHEIILQLFLQHGVNVNAKAYNGDTARSLALINGNMKIVSLIDNHVMPITSLRSEPGLVADLSSSDDAFSKVRPKHKGRMRAAGGGPSIMDGPEAIARLIDRTRDNVPAKQEDGLVPKGYVTFPDEEVTSQASKKLSYRDVTSPINPDDYKLDSSGGRDSFEVEDDTNAFSKTGALTIKSSSGSSGGLAAALGIRREDSLDSDEFPHESSCEDSHPHGNSGDSSSEDGIDETGLSNQIEETLKVKSGDDKASGCEQPSQKSIKRKKSKDKLTTKNVNEIEVMKNSVSEWIDSVQDTNPIPEDNLESRDPGQDDHRQEAASAEAVFEKMSALKPEYQHSVKGTPKEQCKHNAKTFDIGVPEPQVMGKQDTSDTDTGACDSVQQTSNTDTRACDRVQQTSDTDTRAYDRVQQTSDTDSRACGSVQQTSDTDTRACDRVQQTSDTDKRACDNVHQTSSHLVHEHTAGSTSSDFFDQVAQKVQSVGRDREQPVQDSSVPTATQGKPLQYEPCAPPVSALNLLNTDKDTYSSSQDHSTLPKVNPGHQNIQGYYGNPPTVPVQVSAGFPPGFSAYQMFPPGITPNFVAQTPAPGVYPSTVAVTAGRDTSSDTAQTDASSASNALFIEKMGDAQPGDLASFLEQLGLTKYLPTFEEQDVDLQVFLSLTDSDLKEVGIKLFGPRKKMTNAISRWQAKARIAVGELEQAYGDRLAGELQEMGGQLQMALDQVEKLKAQVKQEQQLRNVTETCLMEERAAWQHVQRIIMETRQQCEDFKDVVRKLMQYVNELKARMPVDAVMGHQKRPIRGQNALREEHVGKAKGMLSSDQLPTDSVVRKVDYYMQEIHHLLAEVTGNTDRLLGRNTHTEALDGGYT